MGVLMGYDDWLQAQNCLLGAALLKPDLVPRIVSELKADDFSNNGRIVYTAMAELFANSKTPDEIDPVAIVHKLGGTKEARDLVYSFMGYSPQFSEIERYMAIARQCSKLSRLRSLGADLSSAVCLEDAEALADEISEHLIDRPGLKGYTPSDLLTDFEQRHKVNPQQIPWKLRVVGDYVRLKKGQFIILGAEPSGGKTAFALEQMWAWSQEKRVLFVSLETDEGTIFDRQVASLAGISMDALMDSRLKPEHWEKLQNIRSMIAKRNFKILPAAGLSVAGVKAAAIAYRADIVIIDYLQILQSANKKLSRYEAITEISMALHILAQSTGMIVIALSQVTNRDPSAKHAPLGIHSARESGQIEADADVILMLDKFVEKGLKESGCRANRILRIVKNKNGRCCNIPLLFDGSTQSFVVAPVPNPQWEQAQSDAKKAKQGKAKQEPKRNDEPYEQVGFDPNCPW